MGLLNWMVEKFSEPEPEARGRIKIDEVMARINAPGDHNTLIMSMETANMWRAVFSERLGREVADTPMPAQIDGKEVIIDEDVPTGKVLLEKRLDLYCT